MVFVKIKGEAPMPEMVSTDSQRELRTHVRVLAVRLRNGFDHAMSFYMQKKMKVKGVKNGRTEHACAELGSKIRTVR